MDFIHQVKKPGLLDYNILPTIILLYTLDRALRYKCPRKCVVKVLAHVVRMSI